MVWVTNVPVPEGYLDNLLEGFIWPMGFVELSLCRKYLVGAKGAVCSEADPG